MALVGGSQQVMSSPTTPILTKGDIPPSAQNVPVNVTTDSGNTFEQKEKDTSIDDDLLATIQRTEQLPTAQSYLDTELSASTSPTNGYDHKMMNVVTILPRLLSSSLISLEDFASPMFNTNTIVNPDQDTFRPGWKAVLASRARHCLNATCNALGIDLDSTLSIVNAVDDHLTDVRFQYHARQSMEMRTGEFLTLLRTSPGQVTLYVVLDGLPSYRLACALNAMHFSSGGSMLSTRSSKDSRPSSATYSCGRPEVTSTSSVSSNITRVETATPSPTPLNCTEIATPSLTTRTSHRSAPLLPTLRDDEDILDRAMSRVCASDSGPTPRTSVRKKERIILQRPTPAMTMPVPVTVKSEPVHVRVKSEHQPEAYGQNNQPSQTPWYSHNRSAFRYPVGSAQLQRQRGYTPKREDEQEPPPSTIFPTSPEGGPSPYTNGTNGGSHDSGPSYYGGAPPPYGGPPSHTTASDNSYPRGPYWTHFTVDPYAELVTHPTTGSIYPWYAVRHELGMTLNHPLELGQLHIDKEAFLTYFIDQHYSPDKHYKAFVGRFPTFVAGERDLRPYLIPYLYQVSQHCASFAVYSPPPHTLRAGSNIGAWFQALPPYTRRQCNSVFDGLLAQAFRSKHAGLSGHPELLSLLQPPRQGYDVIYSLASYAQHPALQEFPDHVREPRQLRDTTLDRYIQQWGQHVQRRVLQGFFYCDRYFYQRLYHNMHPVFRDTIGREAYYRVEHISDGPLPSSFSLPNLTAKLLAIARFIGQEQNFQQAPHAIQTSRYPGKPLQVSEVREQRDNRGRQNGQRPVGSNEQRSTKCFLCEGDHIVRDCPILSTVKQNPRALAAMKRALVAQVSNDDASDLVAALSEYDDTSTTEEGTCVETVSENPEDDSDIEDDQDFHQAGHQ